MIGHLEDSYEDTMYIALKQNISSLIPELTKTNRKTKGKKSLLDRIDHYMSQLNINQKQRLYKLYKLDFDLFGYDPGDTLCKNEACIEWQLRKNTFYKFCLIYHDMSHMSYDSSLPLRWIKIQLEKNSFQRLELLSKYVITSTRPRLTSWPGGRWFVAQGVITVAYYEVRSEELLVLLRCPVLGEGREVQSA